MELIAHSCTAFYKKGYAILKKDATNGFQEIKRAKLPRAIERRCPSLLGFFQKYYHHASVDLYNTGNSVKVINIEQELDIEAEKVGLTFNNYEAQLLLPSGWTRPDVGVLPDLDIRTDTCVDVEMQGMEIVGCPAGSDDFCKRYVRSTLKSMLDHSSSLISIQPQAAAKILLNC